jgi:hypothetical protein
MEIQPVTRPLPTHKTTQTQNKHTQTSMRSVGFETTTAASERAKRVHASNRSTTVIGLLLFRSCDQLSGEEIRKQSEEAAL